MAEDSWEVSMQRIPGILSTLAVVCFLAPSIFAETAGQNDIPSIVTLSTDPAGNNQTANSPPSTINQIPNLLPRVSTVRPASLTGSEKWHFYLRTTYGPASFGYTALGAGISQAQGSVPEWGGGMEGYGKRFASSYAQKVINRSVRISLQGLLHEDPRYLASGRSGILSRAVYAASEAFWVRKDSGGTRIGYTRFIGDFSAAYVSRQWRPDSYHTGSDYLAAGLQSLGLTAAKNIWSEFWPDIRRLLRH
jgi:hypothetical protein